MADALFVLVWVIRARHMKRAVVAAMEIIINQSVDVKRTLNRNPFFLLTKIHKKPKIRLW